MSAIADLVVRYLHRGLGADNATPTQYVASAGTVRTAVSAALTQADDYWNGAIVRWDGGANAGKWSNVADFVASTDTLTFDDDLPNAVVNTDTFTMFLGGKYAASIAIPELTSAALSTVTGVTISRAMMLNGEGTGVLRFYISGSTMTWQPPAGVEGARVSVGALGLGASVTIYGGGPAVADRSKCIVVTRTAAALPAGDVDDDVSLDIVRGSSLAAITGTEADGGVTIYRPLAARNVGSSTLYGVRAYCPSPVPAAISTLTADAIGTGATTLSCDDLTGWPTSGYIYNATRTDARYFYARSGNTVSIAAPGAGVRGYTLTSWGIDEPVSLHPWIDIGLDAPGVGSIFEDPSTRATAPSGVTFSCPTTPAAGLLIGDMAASSVWTVWQRLVVPAGCQPVEGARSEVRLYAGVTSL